MGWKTKGGSLAAILAIAIPLITEYEGTEEVPYLDTGGVVTVCTGHTGLDIQLNKIYTKEECKDLLGKDLTVAAKTLQAYVTVPMSDEEAAVYLSFTFNVGKTNFVTSTLLKKLNAGDHVGACNQLTRWVYDNDKWIKGLYNRRKAERDLCLLGATKRRGS